MNDELNTKTDDTKTNAELLDEIKKLREETENQNKKTNANTGSNTLIIIGAIILFVVFIGGGLWKCAM